MLELINLQTSSAFGWIPFLSAIIGGILVLAGQAIDRDSKNKIEVEKTLRELYGDARKYEALMKNNYRELAMAKFHAEYWWHSHITASGVNVEKYYDQHLKSQEVAREVERRIGETKADYISTIHKFQTIKILKSEIDDWLTKISELTNPKAKTYDSSVSHFNLRYEKAEIDEGELREMYYSKLKFFKEINDYLFTQLRTKEECED